MAKKEFLTRDEDRIIFDKKITRRKFLKGSAAAAAITGASLATSGAAGTVLKALAKDEEGTAKAAEDKVFQCVCRPDCGGGTCHLKVTVRNGKVVKTGPIDYPESESLWNRMCQKGMSQPQRIYAPERLKYPMRRAGKRGEGKWEQITWEEAITEITTKWKKSQEEFGNSSILYGFGAGNMAPDWYYYFRLFMALGASQLYEPADMAGLWMAAQVVTRGLFLHGNSGESVLAAKNIFFWGSNATISQQSGWSFTQSAIFDHGAKAIVIDPNYTGVASKANKWVPIRPGTDAALMMAMTKVIIDEGLQDDDYLKNGTVAPYLVKESDGKFLRLSDLGRATTGAQAGAVELMGEASQNVVADTGEDAIVVMGADGTVDAPGVVTDPVLKGTFTIQGIKETTAYDLLVERLAEYTPEKASEICDIPVETIKELAHIFVDGPTTNNVCYGMDHYLNGYTGYHALYTLMFVSGQFAKWGAGMYGGQQASMGFGSDIRSAILTKRTIMPGPTLYLPHLLEVLETGKYGEAEVQPKCLYQFCGNPLGNESGRQHTLETFEKLDFIVVADTIMNNTTKYADIVLPVAHWFEFETITSMITEYAHINEKAIDPLYECKTDIEIANLIGEGMGLGDVMNLSQEDYLRTILSNDNAKSVGMDLDTLREKKNVRNVPKKYIFGENYTLPTPTGRAEFYKETITPNTNYGQELDQKMYSLPHWFPPVEAWHENPLFEKYPLILMSHRDRFKAHSMFTDCAWLVELRPEPTIHINPVDAEARGIKNGDYVKVHNDRGHVVMKAVFNAGLRPGVLSTEKYWRAEQYKEGVYQDLTNPAQNPFISNGGYYDTLCEVEKA